MDVSTNYAIGSSTNSQSSTQRSQSDLTMDDFLKILAETIKNPSMSGESSGGEMDYISQLVQFTTLEQIQTLTDSVDSSVLMTQQQQGLSLLGKEVTLLDDTEIVTGTVEKVKFINGFATIQVNGEDYYMNSVVEVGE